MRYWLMKTEASCYSIDSLKRDKRTTWDGTRNYQVRNMLRDEVAKGDLVLFYHSNAGDETGVVGEMEVVKAGYPDPTQFDLKSEHPDPTSDPKNPRWYAVDVKFRSKFLKPVTLSEIKNDPKFEGISVTQKGNRLSVMPIKKAHYDRIVRLGLS